MTISYPLNLPSHTGIRNIELRATNAVIYEMSPFTFAGQAQASTGQMWQADVTLPPMKRSDAEQWIAWLVSLRGRFGTFTMGDPLGCAPRGVATGTPRVNGASQTGEDLNIDGCTADVTGWLKAGDYIQLGSGATATLHKVLADADTNGSGETTLSLWPHIRTAPLNNATVTVNNTVGHFRLTSNETSWSVNEAAIYGITFSAMEAIS
jgi:hypothetical protein